MNSNFDSGNDTSINTLGYLIEVERKQLEEDKLRLQRNIEKIKTRRSDGNHNKPLHMVNFSGEDHYKRLLHPAVAENDELKENIPTEKVNICMLKNSREEEINKLIDKISKPKEQNFFTANKEQRRSYPQVRNNNSHQFFNPINIREREKDQLSEKFSSSECPLTKPSCRQIAKNLYSSISFNGCKQNNVNKTIDDAKNINREYFYTVEKSLTVEDEEYLRAKYNHPRIIISQHKESHTDFGLDPKMVRIGEFSPLNPNLPGGATVLGLGEWDEKRQFLLEKYRQESRSPSPSPSKSDSGCNQRSIATQTDLGDDWAPNQSSVRSLQPAFQLPENSSYSLEEYGHEDSAKRCTSPQLMLPTIPKCFENMTEKEVKEFIYRQELQKQIEEKNRLKEEMKKKEAEEEAKIEAKIQRDLERMRRQYEEEKLQRLELAIKRRAQEDLLRQQLTMERQKAMEETKTTKKRPSKDAALQNNALKQNERATQSDFEVTAKDRSPRVPYSRSYPEKSTLSNAHKHLQNPLLQPLPSANGHEEFLSQNKYPKNTSLSLYKNEKSKSSTSSKSPGGSEEVDILAQKAIFDTNVKSSSKTNNAITFISDSVKDKLTEVDNMLKQPLLPDTDFALPPVSQPLIHATIPPLSASLQTRHSSSQAASDRTNANILEDKWKVPYAEQDSKQNARILTQLGVFRRQLQEESLRMRQRVRGDSP